MGKFQVAIALALLSGVLVITTNPRDGDAQIQPMPGIPDRKTPMKDYFPLGQGYSWQYKVNGSSSSPPMIVSARGTEKQTNGSYLELVETQVGRSSVLNWYNKMNKGVVLLEASQIAGERTPTRYQPAKPFIKNPLLPGESWRWQGSTGPGSLIRETGKIVGEETVVVPAGQFRVMKVVVTSQITQNGVAITPPVTETRWFAESVGLVKLLVQSSESKATLELVSYSLQPRR